ncbi:MAG TPA: hypothetical protein VH643_23540 [Gemmataceae bacterium]
MAELHHFAIEHSHDVSQQLVAFTQEKNITQPPRILVKGVVNALSVQREKLVVLVGEDGATHVCQAAGTPTALPLRLIESIDYRFHGFARVWRIEKTVPKLDTQAFTWPVWCSRLVGATPNFP